MAEVYLGGPAWGLVFYQPSPAVTLSIRTSQNTQGTVKPASGLTSYTVTDIHGSTVSSGTIGAAATSFTAAAPAQGWINGWYLIQCAGPASYAISCFSILNADTRFMPAPPFGTAGNAYDPSYVGDDFIGYGLSQLGLYRDSTVGSSSDFGGSLVPSATYAGSKANMALAAKYWTKDSARPATWLMAFPASPGVDGVTIGHIYFTRRGSHSNPTTITIGAGTSGGYKITVTETATSAVVEMHDNLADELSIQQKCNADRSGWLYAWGGQQHTAPQQTTVTMPNTHTLGIISAVQALFKASGPGAVWFEGPDNEPGGGNPAGCAAFISAVHAANQDAKAVVPSYLGAQNLASLGGYLSAMQEIGVVPDGFSFHGYGCFDQGDLEISDTTVPGIVSAIKAAWPSAVIFQTEFGENNGIPNQKPYFLAPIDGARSLLGALTYAESAGIPKERFFWFYGSSHGFSFVSWWKNGDGSLLPVWTAARGLSEQLYGRTFVSREELPAPLNRILFAAKWADAASQCWVYRLTGLPGGTLTLTVSGASELTVYDWAGNQATVPVSSGVATLMLDSLITYVTAPAGAMITVQDLNSGLISLGQNLLDPRTNTVVATTSSTSAADQNGGMNAAGTAAVQPISAASVPVDLMAGNRSGVGRLPWQDNSATIPHTLTWTFDTVTAVGRVLLLGEPPFQQSSLIAFHIDYKDPATGTWHTVYTYTAANATTSALAGSWGVGSITGPSAYTAWDQTYQFDCTFPQVTAQAIRVMVTATSSGSSPDAAVLNGVSYGQLGTVGMRLRFAGAYES